MAHSQLLIERRAKIGSSDAAACVGLSPWSDALKIYARLVTELNGDEWTFDNSDADELRFGNLLEPVIAAEYSRRTGREIFKPAVRLPEEFPWSVTHCDFVTTCGRIVEVKNYSSQWVKDNGVAVRKWGEPGTDEIPDDIRCQVVHQMRDMGCRSADVCVLFKGNQFCTYPVEWDQELADLISLAESDLYLRAVERKQPEPDFARPWTLQILSLLTPVREKSFCYLTDCDAELSEFQKAKDQIKVWDQIKDAAQAKIIDKLAGNETGKTLSGWKVTRGRNFLVKPPPTWNDKADEPTEE